MALRDHLEAIKKKRGVLIPEYVVEEAKREDHPLHHRFEWDDTVAGEAWRREQARKLIMEVGIVYTRRDGSKGYTRGFYAIKKDGVFQYESQEEIKADPVSREILLASMKREWEELERRYYVLAEFWNFVEERVTVVHQ